MGFSSEAFLFFFLPVVFIVYYIIPRLKYKNILALAASLLFYAFGEPKAVWIMLLSILINYICGRLMGGRHKKAVLALCCTVNIGLLFVFKYLSFAAELVTGENSFSIHLPVGISFFTFQAMSYVIDCYRDSSLIQKDLPKLALYISFFPQLAAGPIVRYHDIAAQIDGRTHTAEKAAAGIRRFCFGLGKKMLIANTMAAAADHVFSADASSLSAFAALTGAVCYALQIYFDFSGYSDMAVGLGKMFGFDFAENFRYPFAASSMTDFWHRWHISVSSWFKEYVYIPLGGNRKGKLRTYVNKWIVFICTGIWHGANLTFLVWGILHGLCLTAEGLIPKAKNKASAFAGRILTIMIIILTFVIFRADTLSQGFCIIGRMFAPDGDPYVTSELLSMFTPLFLFTLAAALILSFPVVPTVGAKAEKTLPRPVCDILSYILAGGIYILSVLALSENGYNPFIYFRF